VDCKSAVSDTTGSTPVASTSYPKEYFMLLDRKILLEQEIAKLKSEAANMYLSIVISGNNLGSPEYTALQTSITDLEFNLKNLIILLNQGHK